MAIKNKLVAASYYYEIRCVGETGEEREERERKRN
jgi:hypothetical protein